jgi:hypothetical protein
MNSTIAVSARRWEHGWELYVDGQALTQSMTLADAPRMARDALATERGGEPEDSEVTVTPELDGLELRVEIVRSRMTSAQQDLEQAAKDWRAIALCLRSQEHLSVRDTATVLGVSPGRVSQLLGSSRPT